MLRPTNAPSFLFHSYLIAYISPYAAPHDRLVIQKQSTVLHFILEQGLGRWMMTCGKLLLPLVQLMKKDLLSEKYLQADETKLQVLSEKGRLSTSKSYMWLYKTVGTENLKIVYDYSPSRSASTATDFLQGFEGWLQSDAYSGYKRVSKDSGGKIRNVFCWAHARRKFADIVKSSSKATVSAEAIVKIKKLYKIEKDAREQNLGPDNVEILRQEKSKPLLKDLKTSPVLK